MHRNLRNFDLRQLHHARNTVPRQRHWAAAWSLCPGKHFRNGRGRRLFWSRCRLPRRSFPNPRFRVSHHEERVEKTLHLYENAVTEHVAHVEPADHEKTEDEDEQAKFIHEAEASDEAHGAAELSEDEAASLAEHVAEAQIEEEAREAQRRDFAVSDAALESPGLSASGVSSAGTKPLAKRSRIPSAGALDETEEQAEAEEFAAQASESFRGRGRRASGNRHGRRTTRGGRRWAGNR